MAITTNKKSGDSAGGATVGYEAQLWQMADALRGSMDAAEYKHVRLGLLLLKYISDAFEEKRAALLAEKAQGADPEDPDEYRAIEAAQVIEELIGLAKEMREAHARGDALKLSEDELAFYDVLETNDSAVKVFGDDTLRTIAQELVKSVRANVTIDWTLRENVRAQLRVLVKRILRKYGYPPDKQERATETVLEQAALLSEEWATA